LLLKFLHKFYNKEDTPWVTILWKSYYEGKISHAVDPCGSFWWKDVMKLSPIFWGITSCVIANGDTVLFWKDDWLDQIISEKFPRAFSYCLHEDTSVQKFLTASTLADNFSLPLSPEALQEVKDLQEEAASTVLSHATIDSWTYVWGSAFYTSRRYYKYCFREIVPHVAFKWIWKSKCIPRVKFFCWIVFSDRLNTRGMLKRRNFQLNSGYNCVCCDSLVEETIDHLFLRCPFSTSCWASLNIFWQAQGPLLDVIAANRSLWGKPLFMEIFMLAAWNIWKVRNNMVFNGINPELEAWNIWKVKNNLGLMPGC
jgi:hypothetical protein